MLHKAAKKNNIQAAKLLLCAGASPSEYCWDDSIDHKLHNALAVTLASYMGHIDVLHLLVDHRVRVSETSHDAVNCLHHAAEQGHVRIVEALLEYSADVNAMSSSYGSPLYATAGCGHLSDHPASSRPWCGCNATCCNLRRSTALHCAAEAGHVECVRTLLEAGAITSHELARDSQGCAYFIKAPNLQRIAAGYHYLDVNG
ncbi:ankyrin repeat-containing domain protein [Aspergillus spectabilis]